MKTRSLLVVAAGLLALLFFLSCGEGDGCSVKNGELSGQATLPLVPIDLPMYPTDITLDGVAESAQSAIEDYLSDFPFIPFDATMNLVNSALGYVASLIKDASVEILQPGVLSVSVDNQITQTIRDYVKVKRVGVNFEVANDTDKYISAPVEYQLFLGDGALAEKWDPSAMIPFADPRVDEDGKFVVEPGETISLKIDNVPELVDALNNATTIGVGYKSIYRMADLDNGADVPAFIDKFLLCIISKLPGISDFLDLLGIGDGSCPSAEDLIGWHLTVKKFELVIKAESNLDIPPIPGCKEFADEQSLDLLAEACPEEN
jgi:hypothetical protein